MLCMSSAMQFVLLVLVFAIGQAIPIDFDKNSREGRSQSNDEIFRLGLRFRDALEKNHRPHVFGRTEPTTGLSAVYAYPSCTPPSTRSDEFTPNGPQDFDFYFPNVPDSRKNAFPQEAYLYLRTKDPASAYPDHQKTSTPSSKESTPNDVDANLDASNNLVDVHFSSLDCTYCNSTRTIDLSNSYPYAKLDIKSLAFRWFTTDYEIQPQQIKIRVTEHKTQKPLRMSDYFMGTTCDAPRADLDVLRDNGHIQAASLERFSDSFVHITYTLPQSGFSIQLSNLFFNQRARN